MSTTSTSAAPTGGGTSTGSPPTDSDSDTATLYLFTFLATILILILLSASLVLRSYVLRRRYRQRFQQAIADGLFSDLGPGQFDALGFRRSARRFGPKPVMWDTWIHPADNLKADTWSSVMPVAVRCSPLLSPPSSSISSPQSPIVPPCSPCPLQPQPRPSFLSQLRVPSPLLRSPRSPSPPPRQGQPPIRSPTLSRTRLAPPTTPDPNTHPEKDVATLSVYVLIAMPNASAPVYHPAASDVKGKRVDPLESQASDDADPLLRSGARTANDDQRLSPLEFGIVQVRTAE